jgi:hypothetical protein
MICMFDELPRDFKGTFGKFVPSGNGTVGHTIFRNISVENELIFAIRKNTATENIIFKELLFTLIRAI